MVTSEVEVSGRVNGYLSRRSRGTICILQRSHKWYTIHFSEHPGGIRQNDQARIGFLSDDPRISDVWYLAVTRDAISE